MISFLVLFVHFYVQTYWKPKKGENPSVPKRIDELEENGRNELWEKNHQIQNSAFSDDEDQDCGYEDGIDRDDDVELAQNEELTQTLTFSTTTENEEIMGSNGDFDIVQWDNLDESDIIISSDESSDSEKDGLLEGKVVRDEKDDKFVRKLFTSSAVQSSS